MKETSSASHQCTPFSSLELYAPGVPPVWVAWALLLCGLTTVGGLVGLVGPWSGWMPGPALCGGCQLLVGGARSQGG